MAQNRILTKKEFAAEFKIAEITVDRKRKAGILPFHKLGSKVFFTQSDIDNFIRNCEAAPNVAGAVK